MNEEPLETIMLDDSNIIHRPAETLPLPESKMSTGKNRQRGSYALTDNQSGPFEVSDERFFSIEISEGEQAEDYRVVKAKLIATGDNTNVWVLDDADFHKKIGTQHDDKTCKLPDVTYEMAKDTATGFDGIYSRMTDPNTGFGPFELYATAYDDMPQMGDLGDDDHVNILLYDIHALDKHTAGYRAGSFLYLDMCSRAIEDGSNEVVYPLDMFHVDIGVGQGWELFSGEPADKLQIYTTLAHEFQHMLFFIHFGAYTLGNSNYLWFNESLSGLAAMYFVQPGAEIISLDRTAYASINDYNYFTAGHGDMFQFNGSLKSTAWCICFQHCTTMLQKGFMRTMCMSF